MRRIVWGVAMAVSVALGPPAAAALHTERVEYQHDGTALEGYLAYDDATDAKRPGVIVVHEWKGLNPYAQRRARELAGLGYVAFAIDMYGKGVLAQSHEEAAKLSGAYFADRDFMRARARAGLEVLRRHPLVDPLRLAAIGYCFGGTAVLELARSGEPLRGVVSFHGGLTAPTPAQPQQITARILAMRGADDPYITPDQVRAFEAEMTAAGASYRLISYPGAVHSFTVPEAGSDPASGVAYHAEADRQSWEAMRAFLDDVLR